MVKALTFFLCLFLGSTFPESSEGFLFMDKYEWLPSESAHKQYPMRLLKGDLTLKDGSYLYVPGRSVMRRGWGKVDSTHIVGSKYKALPVKLAATWFSFAEDKFFTGEFNLPYESILDRFRKGTISPNNGKKITYDRIIFGFGPQGAVSVWLNGMGEVVEVATFVGKEISLPWKAVTEAEMPRSEFINLALKSLTKEQIQELREHGVPSQISEVFKRRYRWTFSVVGGHQQNILVETLNGEAEYFDFVQTQNVKTHRAIPKSIEARWGNSAGTRYIADVFFDEAEVVAAFRKLSADNLDHPMQLQLELGNNPHAIGAVLKDSKHFIRLNKVSSKTYLAN